MKLQKYGITLERLYEKDIEMVRQYRNSPEIRRYMHFKQHITKKMQRQWYQSIDNHSNYYFIIHYDNKKIGLINIKNIDWVNNTSESGLFLWDWHYVDSPAPLLASLLLSEYGFGFLQGVKSFIRILQDNKKAIDFNKSIGFEAIGPPDYNGLQYFLQTKESFLNKTSKLRKYALALSDSDPHIYLHVEPHDYAGLAQMFFKYMDMSQHPFEMKKEGDTEIYSFLFWNP